MHIAQQYKMRFYENEFPVEGELVMVLPQALRDSPRSQRRTGATWPCSNTTAATAWCPSTSTPPPCARPSTAPWRSARRKSCASSASTGKKVPLSPGRIHRPFEEAGQRRRRRGGRKKVQQLHPITLHPHPYRRVMQGAHPHPLRKIHLAHLQERQVWPPSHLLQATACLWVETGGAGHRGREDQEVPVGRAQEKVQKASHQDHGQFQRLL